MHQWYPIVTHRIPNYIIPYSYHIHTIFIYIYLYPISNCIILYRCVSHSCQRPWIWMAGHWRSLNCSWWKRRRKTSKKLGMRSLSLSCEQQTSELTRIGQNVVSQFDRQELAFNKQKLRISPQHLGFDLHYLHGAGFCQENLETYGGGTQQTHISCCNTEQGLWSPQNLWIQHDLSAKLTSFAFVHHILCVHHKIRIKLPLYLCLLNHDLCLDSNFLRATSC